LHSSFVQLLKLASINETPCYGNGEYYEFDGFKTKSLESPYNAEEVEPKRLMAQLQATFILGRVARV